MNPLTPLGTLPSPPVSVPSAASELRRIRLEMPALLRQWQELLGTRHDHCRCCSPARRTPCPQGPLDLL